MTVAAEFRTEDMVADILQHTKNLAGTTISIDRDLSSEKQQQKKAMLEVKKMLAALDKDKQVTVRDHKLKVDGKWFSWNKEKQLVAGKADGIAELKKIYGDGITTLNINYVDVVSKN